MKLITKWDTCDIAEYQVKQWIEDKEYPDKTEDELFSMACEDSFLYEMEWESLTEYLTEKMKEKNKDVYWKANVNNFGWRNLDGIKYFKAETGSDLLREILPDTDCTFKVFNYKKGFAIQNWHHDSPMGNEWYYILPIAYSTYEKNSY